MSQTADGTQSALFNGNDSPYSYPSQGEKWSDVDLKHLIDDLDALKLRLGVSLNDSPVAPFWVGHNTLADRIDSISSGGGGLPVATTPEAENGIVDNKTMTPLKSKQANDFQRPFASLVDSESGTNNTKINTPLRTFEAINYKERNFGEQVILDSKFITGLNVVNAIPLNSINITGGCATVGDLSDSNDRHFIRMPFFNDLISNLLDTGTIQNDTIYFIHLITASNTNRQNPFPFPPKYIISLDGETPTLPTNYDWFRMIGIIRTDSISNVMKFNNLKSGNSIRVEYLNDFSDRTVLAGGSSEVLVQVPLSSWVPNAGELLEAELFIEQRTNNDVEITSFAGGEHIALLLDAKSSHQQSIIHNFTVSGSGIWYQNLSAGGSVNIVVMGFTYER